jgi:hypothetical protein
VPKSDYLSFERTPRPEEVQENPPEQIEKLEHRLASPDSGAQPKRMEFAVGTTERRVSGTYLPLSGGPELSLDRFGPRHLSLVLGAAAAAHLFTSTTVKIAAKPTICWTTG